MSNSVHTHSSLRVISNQETTSKLHSPTGCKTFEFLNSGKILNTALAIDTKKLENLKNLRRNGKSPIKQFMEKQKKPEIL
jgi:hypothetical protein